MILSIGELLADIIADEADETVLRMYGGGAPFNVAVNAKRAGGKAGFIGRVGNDPVGRFLKRFAAGMELDYCDIQTDEVRNTTMAFVTLKDGERDFSFFRHYTADCRIDADGLDFGADGLNIVHLGSLMLGEEAGRSLADKIVKKTKRAGKLLSFDANYRADIFHGAENARAIYAPYLESADILKFSEDELELFTGKTNFDSAIRETSRKDRLLLVTLGSRGSYYSYNGLQGFVRSEKVIPIDSTGAGDAFFGFALKELDGVALSSLTDEFLQSVLKKANLAGAIVTQHKGAL